MVLITTLAPKIYNIISINFKERVFPHCSGVATAGAANIQSTDKDFDSEDLSAETTDGMNHQSTPADFLLSCIAHATCHQYQEAILKVPELSPNSTKQLYTDIGEYKLWLNWDFRLIDL